MDFWIDIGATVMLRILKEGVVPQKYRSVFLKVFKAIADAYRLDEDFRRVMLDQQLESGAR